ncbi:Uncharacterised protein [Mycobacteroides abscessus subsp. abscessus]|nr:Uncharacterised protein [Mycobacteroides abscessus subsp. abscessus]
MPWRFATIAGMSACPETLSAVRPMSTIGSIASSSPTPSSGSPSVDRVSVSITVAPVVPAVAAEPMTETKTMSRYWMGPSSMPKNCATKTAAIAG